MMKKMMLVLASGIIALPLVAAEQVAAVKEAPMGKGPARMESAHKAHEAQQAEMKATQEKMEKLVKEYQQLKGKKQEEKKAEIVALVSQMHEKQLEFKAQKLAQFEERLAQMKAKLVQEQSSANKQAWVDEKTAAIIENGGDLKAVFGHSKDFRGKDGKIGRRADLKDAQAGRAKGPRDAKGPRKAMQQGGQIPPKPNMKD